LIKALRGLGFEMIRTKGAIIFCAIPMADAP